MSAQQVTRLKDPADFRIATRNGVRIRRSTMVVYVLPVEGGTRVGFVVSKAVGNAVVRNRVKRRLREAIRTRVIVPDAATPSLIVVRALPAAARSTFDELAKDLQAGVTGCAMRIRRTSGKMTAKGTL
ncbi:MAG: ribonuclease P protein component [Cellulomonadaceae bacterium]|nr:ribonuclease P protein component [Cellulomonadaceae bacterium]